MIPTLFAEGDTLDLENQRKVIRFALDSGAHGVVFPGVASEYDFLSSEERGRLIELVVEEVDGRVPIIGGASAPTAEESIIVGRQCVEQGVKVLMIMAPQGLGREVTAQKEYFETITRKLDGVEIMLQNAPNPVGAGLTVKELRELLENPAITYVKEETLPSGPAITALQKAGLDQLKGIFGGGGARYVVDELERGALGAMPAIELVDLHVALYESFRNGDRKKARELYRLSLPLLVSQAVFRMRLTKFVLAKRGVISPSGVRAPLPELDEFNQKDIEQMLTDLEGMFP